MLFATTAVAQTTLPSVSVETKKSPTKAKAKAKSAPAQGAVQTPEPAQTDGPAPNLPNTLQAGTGIGRIPGTVQDVPQTVNVVGQQQIKEQNITTIDQALRNVPGVTVAIGEGNGGLNGDQFRIRGFQAKGDVYIDGLRDFGVYVRDSFAYEEVQVFKGPSSENFGMGTGGGAINLQQKTAHLGNAGSIETTIGMGPMLRSTLDINTQINSTTAARAVIMYHEQDLVDRDHVFSDRWGFLGSLAFGLGTDTTLTLNYLHQHGDRMPEYGVPSLPKSGTFPVSKTNVGTPITEYLVPRSTFYGKETDHDVTDADILTARLKSKLSESVTVFNDTRLAFYQRDFATSVPECANNFPAPTTPAANPSDPTTNTTQNCQNRFAAGDYDNAVINFGGGNPGFIQESWGAQNITTLLARFNTAGLKHEIVAGIDVYYQNDERALVSTSTTPGKQPTANGFGWLPSTITNPVYENLTGYFLFANPTANNGRKESEATNVGLFASDRLWLTKELSILGGLRWDDFQSDYRVWCVGADVLTTPQNDACNGWKNLERRASFGSRPRPRPTMHHGRDRSRQLGHSSPTTRTRSARRQARMRCRRK